MMLENRIVEGGGEGVKRKRVSMHTRCLIHEITISLERTAFAKFTQCLFVLSRIGKVHRIDE
jgi:hypothetical protein